MKICLLFRKSQLSSGFLFPKSGLWSSGWILSSLFGIKLSPANEYKLKQFEASTRRRLAGSVARRKSELKRRLDRKELTRPEYEKQVRALIELRKKLLQERPDISD